MSSGPEGDEEGQTGLEPAGERKATRREERLQEEVEALKGRLRELETRIDAMSGGRKADDGRIRTFVAGFDEALEGGIPKGHVVVLGGPSGTMKTSLGLNLVHPNRLDGVRRLYVSLEEGPARLPLAAGPPRIARADCL